MKKGYIMNVDWSIKMKKVRKRLGYTQSEMAKAMGYESDAIISQIENGHREITGVASKCLEYLEIVMNKK